MCLALEGEHGVEGAVGALRVNGVPVGCPRRAPSYPANVWEAAVRQMHGHYTYYVDVTPEMVGARVDAVVLVRASGVNGFEPVVWLTACPTPWVAREVVLAR